MVKHTQEIRRLMQTNCLSVFDHFVGLALTGLRFEKSHFTSLISIYESLLGGFRFSSESYLEDSRRSTMEMLMYEKAPCRCSTDF